MLAGTMTLASPSALAMTAYKFVPASSQNCTVPTIYSPTADMEEAVMQGYVSDGIASVGLILETVTCSAGARSCTGQGRAANYNLFNFTCAWQALGTEECSAGVSLTGECVNSCDTGQEWNEVTRQCEDPESTPEPGIGDSDDVRVTVCEPPTDCSDPANWNPWSNDVNHNGWNYKASAPTACYEQTDGSVQCQSHIVYQGDGPASNHPTSPSSQPASNDVQQQTAPDPTCPAGYAYDSASGLCIQPPQPGTESTPESPGSSPTPGTSVCPVGYALQPDGTCKSQSAGPQGDYLCPAGYTLQNGECVGDGGQTGNVSPPESEPQIDFPSTDSAFDEALNEFQNALTDSTAIDALPFTPNISIPSGYCAPFEFSIFGQSKSIDLCPLLAQVRSVLAWFYSMLFVLYVWRSLAGATGGKAA